MSDLSRLRARLVRIERRGKALHRELDELRSPLFGATDELGRATERQVLRLERELDEQRKDWMAAHALVRAEERRLIENPTAFLRFT